MFGVVGSAQPGRKAHFGLTLDRFRPQTFPVQQALSMTYSGRSV